MPTAPAETLRPLSTAERVTATRTRRMSLHSDSMKHRTWDWSGDAAGLRLRRSVGLTATQPLGCDAVLSCVTFALVARRHAQGCCARASDRDWCRCCCGSSSSSRLQDAYHWLRRSLRGRFSASGSLHGVAEPASGSRVRAMPSRFRVLRSVVVVLSLSLSTEATLAHSLQLSLGQTRCQLPVDCVERRHRVTSDERRRGERGAQRECRSSTGAAARSHQHSATLFFSELPFSTDNDRDELLPSTQRDINEK